MSEPLTKARLDEIEARANAATPGPWQTRFIYRMFRPARADEAAAMETEPDQDWPDAEFIAESRSDVPALIAEVRRLEGELETKSEEFHDVSAALERALGREDKLKAENAALNAEVVRLAKERQP